jgi:hypothetical protein
MQTVRLHLNLTGSCSHCVLSVKFTAKDSGSQWLELFRIGINLRWLIEWVGGLHQLSLPMLQLSSHVIHYSSRLYSPTRGPGDVAVYVAVQIVLQVLFGHVPAKRGLKTRAMVLLLLLRWAQELSVDC